MSQWIVPFQGRNHSTSIKLNFLWNEGPVFVMDNHRAAMWCWLDYIKKSSELNVFHVDRHYDALFSEKDYSHISAAGLEDITIDDYLSCGYDNEFFAVTPVFRWDNYLGLFLKKYDEKINTLITATHEKGSEPEIDSFAKCYPWEFPDVLNKLSGEWIFNLDLDYFCSRNSSGEMDIMFDDRYIFEFAEALAECIKKKNIRILTVSLSPECTGGWETSEKLLAFICEGLKVDFKLPL